MRGDTYDVATDDIAERWWLAVDFHERLRSELVLPRRERVRESVGDLHGDRGEDAARNGQQVRCEDEVRIRTIAVEHGAHLGQVAVRVPDGVSPEVFRDLAEQ